MAHRLISFAASLLLSLAAPAALAPVRADFGTPVMLSGGAAQGHWVAVDADGNALAVWYRWVGTEFRVEARARSAAGVLGPVNNLAVQNAKYPRVAVRASGSALVVWQGFDGTKSRIQARTGSTAGGFGEAILNLSAAGQNADRPQVAVGAAGKAMVVWRRFDGAHYRIQARTVSAAGMLGSVQTLSKAGQNAVDPQVAINRDGNAVVVWYRSDGTNDRVQARMRSAAGVLGAVRTLSEAGQDAFGPQVGIDADGNALVVWQRSDGTNDRIQMRALSAAGTLGTIHTLSEAGQDANLPYIAVNGAGQALVVWMRFDGAHYRVQARSRSAAGVLGFVQTLSAAGQPARNPQVAIDADGNAVVVWHRSDGNVDRIQARTRSAAGPLGPVQTLTGGGGYDSHHPRVAVSADGKAVAVWRYRGVIHAAAGP